MTSQGMDTFSDGLDLKGGLLDLNKSFGWLLLIYSFNFHFAL